MLKFSTSWLGTSWTFMFPQFGWILMDLDGYEVFLKWGTPIAGWFMSEIHIKWMKRGYHGVKHCNFNGTNHDIFFSQNQIGQGKMVEKLIGQVVLNFVDPTSPKLPTDRAACSTDWRLNHRHIILIKWPVSLYPWFCWLYPDHISTNYIPTISRLHPCWTSIIEQQLLYMCWLQAHAMGFVNMTPFNGLKWLYFHVSKHWISEKCCHRQKSWYFLHASIWHHWSPFHGQLVPPQNSQSIGSHA